MPLLVQDLNGGEDTDPAEVPGLIFERVIALTTKCSGTCRQRSWVYTLHLRPAAQALASRVLEKVLLYATGENANLSIIDPCLGGGALAGCTQMGERFSETHRAQLKTWPSGPFLASISVESQVKSHLTLRIESKADVAFHLQMRTIPMRIRSHVATSRTGPPAGARY